MNLTTEEFSRIASKITYNTTGCWISNWSLQREDGYTQIWLRGTNRRLHVVLYEYLKGPVPQDLQLDHICRIHRCVNPAHLEPVTNKENIRRYQAHLPKVTHCYYGHELSGDNLVLTYRKGRNPTRECRTCNNKRAMEGYWRRKDS